MKNSKTSYQIIFLIIAAVFLSYGTSIAQTGSLKDLKNIAKQVQDINKSMRPGDPWTIKNIITPKELLREINTKDKKKRPVLLQVGFEFLYNQGHIPGSIYAGPASRKSGIKKLRAETKAIPHNKEVVIYCGCCGWTECPNIHPAFKVMKNLGFKNLKVLYLPNNLTKDWVNKKYPIVR